MTDNYPPVGDRNSGGLLDYEKQPLQLRRGSTSQKRKEILEKYNHQLNESVDETNYNQPKLGIPHKGDATDIVLNKDDDEVNQSMIRLESELKGDRKKKYFFIVGVIAVVIAIIIIIAVASNGGSKP